MLRLLAFVRGPPDRLMRGPTARTVAATDIAIAALMSRMSPSRSVSAPKPHRDGNILLPEDIAESHRKAVRRYATWRRFHQRASQEPSAAPQESREVSELCAGGGLSAIWNDNSHPCDRGRAEAFNDLH